MPSEPTRWAFNPNLPHNRSFTGIVWLFGGLAWFERARVEDLAGILLPRWNRQLKTPTLYKYRI